MDKEELRREIGARIYEARTQAGWTQAQLAEALSISSADYISRVENGVYGLSVEKLIDVCRVLNITADELFLGETPSERGADELARLTARLQLLEPGEFGPLTDIINSYLYALSLKEQKLRQRAREETPPKEAADGTQG